MDAKQMRSRLDGSAGRATKDTAITRRRTRDCSTRHHLLLERVVERDYSTLRIQSTVTLELLERHDPVEFLQSDAGIHGGFDETLILQIGRRRRCSAGRNLLDRVPGDAGFRRRGSELGRSGLGFGEGLSEGGRVGLGDRLGLDHLDGVNLLGHGPHGVEFRLVLSEQSGELDELVAVVGTVWVLVGFFDEAVHVEGLGKGGTGGR